MQDRTKRRTSRLRLRAWRDAAGRTGRRILLPALLPACLLAAPAAADEAGDTPERRIEAATTYLELVPVERMADRVAGNVLLLVPEEKRDLFRQGVSEGLAAANIEEIMVKIVAKHFTAAEIEAMTAFYGSAEGQAIERKLKGYMADISLHVIPIIQGAVTEVVEKHFE